MHAAASSPTRPPPPPLLSLAVLLGSLKFNILEFCAHAVLPHDAALSPRHRLHSTLCIFCQESSSHPLASSIPFPFNLHYRRNRGSEPLLLGLSPRPRGLLPRLPSLHHGTVAAPTGVLSCAWYCRFFGRCIPSCCTSLSSLCLPPTNYANMLLKTEGRTVNRASLEQPRCVKGRLCACRSGVGVGVGWGVGAHHEHCRVLHSSAASEYLRRVVQAACTRVTASTGAPSCRRAGLPPGPALLPQQRPAGTRRRAAARRLPARCPRHRSALQRGRAGQRSQMTGEVSQVGRRWKEGGKEPCASAAADSENPHTVPLSVPFPQAALRCRAVPCRALPCAG